MKWWQCFISGVVSGWVVSQATAIAICEIFSISYGSANGAGIATITGFVGGSAGVLFMRFEKGAY